jgi:hypothetical protein
LWAEADETPAAAATVAKSSATLRISDPPVR